MREEAGYNGWTNYETWATALWMDNDYGTYAASRERARGIVAEWVEDGGREPEGVYADELKDEYEEAMPDLGASIWADLLHGSFCEIDWYEIAASIIREVREEVSA